LEAIKMAIIGIDLGTTNSLVAYFSENGPAIIPNAHGENLTPSVVSMGDGELFVGKIAKERLITHPELTASVFKRSMGSQREYQLGNKKFLPEELSSFVIKRLKEDAEAYLGESIEEAVVSVPAYFNDAQRRTTKLAGELAGLKVERIVNEPTAVAVAYGIHEKSDYKKYLVFDLGGGTFDVSVLEKYGSVMEVRAVAGDNYLGGEDFTDVLIEMFTETNAIDLNNLTLPELSAVYKAAEMAKCTLSKAYKATMSCVINSRLFITDIDAVEYKDRCKGLLDRLRDPIKRAVSDASISFDDIDSVLLAGGATRLPFIKEFIKTNLGLTPTTGINPDEVVALGAAVHAALKARDKSITEIVLTDVCPYTLGTEVSVQRGGNFYEGGYYLPIIERNSVVPVSKVERLYTLHDNQTSIRVRILQGESRRTKENILLGEITIPVPAAKAGEEAVDVRYTYDINGILEVEVKVVSTQVEKKIIIEQNPGVISKEEVEKRLAELSSLKIHPRDKEEIRYLMARGERLYEESIGETRDTLSDLLIAFDVVLDSQNDRKIREFCEKFEHQLDEIEHERIFPI
jgi:molecular chaperone HscC